MSQREWTPETPYVPFKGELPATRTEALSLLRRLDDDPDRLTEAQQQAIRKLYRLDDSRSVEQLIRDGEISIITDGLEDEP